MDATAVFLAAYNRNATISGNEFAWLGMNAIATFGRTEEEDATQGLQPWGTQILYNKMHELGIYELQSSAWFSGKSCLNRAEGNLMFNGPRAMINLCVPPQQALRSAARPDETDLSDVRVAPRALFFFQQRRLRRRPQYEPQRHVEHLPRDW
jgi:hypothetical protein